MVDNDTSLKCTCFRKVSPPPPRTNTQITTPSCGGKRGKWGLLLGRAGIAAKCSSQNEALWDDQTTMMGMLHAAIAERWTLFLVCPPCRGRQRCLDDKSQEHLSHASSMPLRLTKDIHFFQIRACRVYLLGSFNEAHLHATQNEDKQEG